MAPHEIFLRGPGGTQKKQVVFKFQGYYDPIGHSLTGVNIGVRESHIYIVLFLISGFIRLAVASPPC